MGGVDCLSSHSATRHCRARCSSMSELMARVPRPFSIAAIERADAAIPGWLPQTIPGTVRGPGTRLVFVAGLVAGAQAVVPRSGHLSPALAGLLALYALSLV